MIPSDAVALDPPSPSEWAHLGCEPVEELHGGHQSRVFRVRRGGRDVVVKLTDSRQVDIEDTTCRVALVDALAHRNPEVVGPLPVGDDLVTPVGRWLAVGYPFVAGERPDVDRPRDVEAMGSTLARLHRSLAELPDHRLPRVAALRIDGPEPVRRAAGRRQLLHGDYSSSNLRVHEGRLRIFDFDDCGYGPVEFEIGNALYMVLFDAAMSDEPAVYERFRPAFVAAYEKASGMTVAEAALDEAIARRRSALRYWLDHLDEAPVGIRASPPSWRQELRTFAEGDDG